MFDIRTEITTDGFSTAETAKILGLTSSIVKDIEENALRKMRHPKFRTLHYLLSQPIEISLEMYGDKINPSNYIRNM